MEGSYFYRHYLPAKYMQGIHQVHIKHRASYQDFRDYDLIILQSQWNLSQKGKIQALQAQGKKVVFEIDDNIWAIPHGNESRNYWTPDKLKDIKEMFTVCDAIITTTKPLANILRQFNSEVYVIPNYVEEGTEANERQTEGTKERPLSALVPDASMPSLAVPIRIGYAGSMSHAPDFTPEIIRALKDIKIKYNGNSPFPPLKLRGGGEAGGVKVELIFFGYMPSELKDIVEYHDYVQPLQYLETLNNLYLDIGIIPCEINKFNHCKSNLKFLEYSMAGIATIASPVQPYLSVERHRGTEAQRHIDITQDNSYDSWFHGLSALIDKEKLRADIAMYANAFVKNYLIKNKIAEIDKVYNQIVRKKGIML